MPFVAPSVPAVGDQVTAAWAVAVATDLTEIGAAWTSFTPAFTASGTPPSLGTGNTVGNYTLTGKKVDGTMEVLWGTAPTAGTGFYLFNLPVAPNTHGVTAMRVGTITLVKASTGAVVVADLVLVNASQVKFTYPTAIGTAGLDAGAAQPWVPLVGDIYYARFAYEAA